MRATPFCVPRIPAVMAVNRVQNSAMSVSFMVGSCVALMGINASVRVAFRSIGMAPHAKSMRTGRGTHAVVPG